ncbi:MAG: DUF4389 domain-containing protein [Aeromicrobium sp.]
MTVHETSAARRYPVRVTADLDPHLSRGLWLVKWLLAIPHYVVLVALWIAFAVASVVAFFAILFTGRFPHRIFDFNVGVMRWTWRVTYYAYGVLGTDRYPPFTLSDVPDYPAHLEVDRPERLSRGLVLIKWWLLALPHYLVIAFFVGGGIFAVDQASDHPPGFLLGGGLVGLLVLFAAVVLLFTGRYPRALFDLIVGMQRWVLRVAAYVALMTDVYPPFRLDMGGHEGPPTSARPEAIGGDGSGPAVGPAAAPAGRPPGRGAGAITALVIGALSLVLAFGLLLGAVGLWAAKSIVPDDDGFFTAPTASCRVSSYAITSESLDVEMDGVGDLTPSSIIGDARVTVESRTDQPVFVGLARTADVESFLRGVSRSTMLPENAWDDDGTKACRDEGGTAAPAVPGTMGRWTEESSGPGAQTIRWPIEEGDWTVVVMNADGSAGLDVDIDAGATLPGIKLVIAGLFIGAGIFTLVGLALVIGSRSRPAQAAP